MATPWFKGTMKSLVFICQVLLIVITRVDSVPPECENSPNNRPPEDTDITVTCGTQFLDLSILLCPLYFANYNESLLILNNQSRAECRGTTDFSVQPPVIRYRFSIDEQSVLACGNKIEIINEVGTGDFSDFSNVQTVTISGMVVTFDSTTSLITYRPMVTYMFSCTYPLQYVMNNNQLNVGGAQVAVNGNNGSFITSLKFKLYSNEFYNESLIIPETGLPLKTNIYAEISATSLTDSFNVLLWWCIATMEPYTEATAGYNLFVGCDVEAYTKLGENGVSDKARFMFQAFRFVEHQGRAVSTFFLHCFTGLCQKDECSQQAPVQVQVEVQVPVEVLVQVQVEVQVEVHQTGGGEKPQSHNAPTGNKVSQEEGDYTRPLVGVIVCVAVLALLMVVMGVCFTWATRNKIPL
ncbi:zona pellucida-like domain-containing protein 1 [Boleophthalmus pectinirostris]|uniref:zona pellucida-like domain-containing protein 1 n=1 Tax=Boleophthalmus pectinirostris TaxID=150288 RepID=UPI00242DCE7D|nr:zona pellucida-like domain-containing protein 1 [Boleophthalmus pectinirostris]